VGLPTGYNDGVERSVVFIWYLDLSKKFKKDDGHENRLLDKLYDIYVVFCI